MTGCGSLSLRLVKLANLRFLAALGQAGPACRN